MNRPFVALLAALFAGGVAAAPAKALLPAYVESVLQQPPLLTSTLMALHLGCGGLFALAGGAVSDLLSRRVAVLVGLSTALFGAALFAVRDPVLLMGVAVLWGVAGGFQSAGGQSFLMAAVSRARLGSATAVYFVSSTASAALGAFLAGNAADAFGFAAVAAGAAGLALAAVVLAAIFLPPLGTDAPDAGAGPAARPRGAAAWTLAGYADLLRRPDVVALCGLRYFPTVAWGVASLAIPLLVFRLSGTAGTVGLYGMISLLAASAAQLATGREIDRRTRRAGSAGEGGTRLLVPALVTAILGAAACVALAHQWLVGLFIGGTLWAMSAWALSTTMPPLIHELGAGRDDGRLVALTHLLWSAGMLSGTFGAGALIDVHATLPFVLALVCLAATLIIGRRFAQMPLPGVVEPHGVQPPALVPRAST